MICENCNEELKIYWCEECWVEWFAYNNPSVLDAAVWPAAEPPLRSEPWSRLRSPLRSRLSWSSCERSQAIAGL